MTDDRHPVIIDSSAPPDPGYVLELGEAFAEIPRALNHLTRHHEALEDPYDGDRLIRKLDSAAQRLPQLLDQIASWYEREAADGKLEVTSGEDRKDAPAMAVVAVRMRADAARVSAEQLQSDLASIARVTSTLAAADRGGRRWLSAYLRDRRHRRRLRPREAGVVHTSYAPCPHDGEPACPAPLHMFGHQDRAEASACGGCGPAGSVPSSSTTSSGSPTRTTT